METSSIYLLTGASGFLGSNICRQLLDAGKQVRAFILPGDKAAGFIPVGVQIVEGDLSDKAEASNLVLDAAAEGMDACIVMPTGIMGPGDNSISTTTGTVIRILKGEMSMGIDGSFNMADVRDLAAGVISAVAKGRRGESYILGNEVVTFKEFARLLSDESGCRRMRFFLPCGLARRIAASLERKASRKGEKPLLTTYSVDVLAMNNEYDSSKAGNELGYRCRPYRQTIREEVDWLRNEGLLA